MATVRSSDVEGPTYRQLDHWVRQGYLRPEGKTGTGNRRSWSTRERRVALIMSRLVAAGLTPQLAVRVARAKVHGTAKQVSLIPGMAVVFY